MSTQFVACKAIECPYNEERQCRALSISVDIYGRCLKKDIKGDEKSITETYVELTECLCSSCNSWEELVYRESGILRTQGNCILGKDLFFRHRNESLHDGPFCEDHEKQVEEPPAFQTVL